MKCCFILMKRAGSLTPLNQLVKLADPSTNLAKITRMDMMSVSFLRNELLPPTGRPATEADGQS